MCIAPTAVFEPCIQAFGSSRAACASGRDTSRDRACVQEWELLRRRIIGSHVAFLFQRLQCRRALERMLGLLSPPEMRASRAYAHEISLSSLYSRMVVMALQQCVRITSSSPICPCRLLLLLFPFGIIARPSVALEDSTLAIRSPLVIFIVGIHHEWYPCRPRFLATFDPPRPPFLW